MTRCFKDQNLLDDSYRTVYLVYIAQQLMKKLFSIVKKLSEKMFAELHSDWPKLRFGSQALVKRHKNLKCISPNTPMVRQ